MSSALLALQNIAAPCPGGAGKGRGKKGHTSKDTVKVPHALSESVLK